MKNYFKTIDNIHLESSLTQLVNQILKLKKQLKTVQTAISTILITGHVHTATPRQRSRLVALEDEERRIACDIENLKHQYERLRPTVF